MIKTFEKYNENDPYNEENWSEKKFQDDGRNITIKAFDRDSNRFYGGGISFVNNLEEMTRRIDEFREDIPFNRYYCETEVNDDFNDDEIKLLDNLDIGYY